MCDMRLRAFITFILNGKFFGPQFTVFIIYHAALRLNLAINTFFHFFKRILGKRPISCAQYS